MTNRQKRTELGGGQASPPYSFAHSGLCIVAGNAACLHEDLKSVWDKYPETPVIAVNGAAREVKAIALYSKHPDRFMSLRWIHHQRRKFGFSFSVHGSKYVEDMPWVNYWWEDTRGGGGSAWGARKLAWLMGFETVVLCGCPMIPGPYVGNHNMQGFMYRKDVVDNFRSEIKKDTEWLEGVHSMSGWTRELLGGIK